MNQASYHCSTVRRWLGREMQLPPKDAATGLAASSISRPWWRVQELNLRDGGRRRGCGRCPSRSRRAWWSVPESNGLESECRKLVAAAPLACPPMPWS